MTHYKADERDCLESKISDSLKLLIVIDDKLSN